MIGRLSLVKAVSGRGEEVVRLYQLLDEALKAREGYVAGCVFVDQDDPSEVGRLALWRSQADVDHAAADDHIVALRSQLHLAIQSGHTEKVVDVISTVNLP